MFQIKKYVIIFIRISIAFFLFAMANQKHGIVDFYNGNPKNIADFMTAMQSTGLYWNMIAISQVTIGALLMSQRFSLLGAIMLVPMLFNVFFITVSLNFGTTIYLNATLLILNFILLAYDYKKLLPIIGYQNEASIFKKSTYRFDVLILFGIGLIILDEVLSLFLHRNLHLKIVGISIFIIAHFYFYKKKSYID
ncbi:MAG: hypothetical protein RI955_159 [Bacteroidota bacterium]|jgi:hypothetical protein